MIKTLQNVLRQDRERFVVPKGVQDVIPVSRIWSDGIFKGGSAYTKTFRFSDINYAMLSKELMRSQYLRNNVCVSSFESMA